MIDWLAVEMVCQGTRLALRPDEKRMVVRRLDHRMLAHADNNTDILPWQLRARDVAERLNMSLRNVQRLSANLPPADKQPCPVCREPMWVIRATGCVEPHGNRLNEQCPMSDRPTVSDSRPRGLAAIRPDLYAWLTPA